MDDPCRSSYYLFGGSHGDGTDSEHSYGSAGRVHKEQDVSISLQVQEQLKQICMLMDTEAEEHGYTGDVPMPSLSTTFCSFSGSTKTTTSCHQPAEISSLPRPLSLIANVDHHGLFYGNLDTIVNLNGLMTQEPHREQAQSKIGGAFRPYARHLSPRKESRPGVCGQRAIKDAMSALARMHRVKLAKWQSLQMEMAAPPSVASNSHQVQHVLSERKRREKLNDSFKALRTVLPPGPKKNRASTLIRARDYVNTLKSRVCELEEKNRVLVQSKLHGGEQDDRSSEQIEVDITNTAAAKETSQELSLKIVVGSGSNAMDALVTILPRLKEVGDVRLVVVDTGSR